MTILCPSNFSELKSMMTRALYHEQGAVAIRYPRGGQGSFIEDTTADWAVCVQKTTSTKDISVTIISYGIMINEAIVAADLLNQQGIGVQVWKVNEISTNHHMFSDAMKETFDPNVFVLEDVVHQGCFGQTVIEALQGTAIRVELMNTGDRFCRMVALRMFINIAELTVIVSRIKLFISFPWNKNVRTG